MSLNSLFQRSSSLLRRSRVHIPVIWKHKRNRTWQCTYRPHMIYRRFIFRASSPQSTRSCRSQSNNRNIVIRKTVLNSLMVRNISLHYISRLKVMQHWLIESILSLNSIYKIDSWIKILNALSVLKGRHRKTDLCKIAHNWPRCIKYMAGWIKMNYFFREKKTSGDNGINNLVLKRLN